MAVEEHHELPELVEVPKPATKKASKASTPDTIKITLHNNPQNYIELNPGFFPCGVGQFKQIMKLVREDTARRLYSELLHKLTAPKPQQAAAKPLTGKYAKLRDDLKAALAAGRAVEDDDPEDGGACNFDAASLLLPRWKEALVEQAAEEAGTGCFTWSLFGKKRFVFRPNTNGQANARSRNAEAMTDALARMGYQAFCYQQLD